MSKISAIVVAAGRGERFDDKQNKVFAKLGEQPLFLRALQLFCNREDVCQTLLVVSPDDMEEMKSKYGPNIGFMGVKLVEGGTERWESVAKGMAEVSDDAEFVAVHDAVRVCIAEQWIDNIFEAAGKNETAVPTIPVSSTLKRVNDDRTISETVPRAGLHLAQTPQVFRRELIQEAYDKLMRQPPDPNDAPTDDAQVVAAAGHSVMIVDGDPRNIKITTKGDLALAGAILRALPQKPTARRGAFEEAQW